MSQTLDSVKVLTDNPVPVLPADVLPETPIADAAPTLARLPPSELEQWRESKKHPQPAAEPELTEESPVESLEASPEPAQVPDKPKKKGSIRERFADLTRERYEAKAEAKVERDRREALERELSEIRAKAGTAPRDGAEALPAERQVAATGKPSAADFATYDDYVEALTDWKQEQREIRAKQAAADQQAAERHKSAVDGYRAKLPEARTRYADFDTVTANAKFPLTPVLEHILVTSDYGPDLAYFLAHPANEAVTAKILASAGADQIRALGQLEARLEQTRQGAAKPAKPAVSMSAAPPPISPIGSGATTTVPALTPHSSLRDWRAIKKARAQG